MQIRLYYNLSNTNSICCAFHNSNKQLNGVNDIKELVQPTYDKNKTSLNYSRTSI